MSSHRPSAQQRLLAGVILLADHDDTLLWLAEKLAERFGFRLTPDGSQAQEFTPLGHLAQELEAMSTVRLIQRTKMLEQQRTRIDRITQRWRTAYADLAALVDGVTLPGVIIGPAPLPPALDNLCKAVEAEGELARQILAARIADEALAEVAGTRSAADAITVLRTPPGEAAPANPDAA